MNGNDSAHNGTNGSLPPGWAWTTVAELCTAPADITDGPFGSNLKTSHYTTSGPCVIRLQNIGDGVFRDSRAHISREHFERLRKHEAIVGDLVIAALGESLPRSCIVPPSLGPAIVKADCVRVRPSKGISVAFVNYALNSEGTRRRTTALLHGVGRPRLNGHEIKRIRIPLAPQNEQARIVEAIEQQLTRLDAGVAALKRVEANLKRYKAAVLKAAVEGRLTERWRAAHPNVEPASELLKRILAERRRSPTDACALWQPALEGLPATWTVVPFGDVLDVQGGSQPPKSTFRFAPAGGYVRLLQIRDFGDRPVPTYVPSGRVTKFCRADDVLIARYGASLGRIVTGMAGAYNVALAKAIFDYEILAPRYVYYLLQTPIFQTPIHMISRSAQNGFNKGEIFPIRIPVPPRHEQDAIVESIGEYLSLGDASLDLLATNNARASRLRQSILKQAFEGKLVPQDPTDEPASVLLDRIRAERLQASPSRQTRKSNLATRDRRRGDGDAQLPLRSHA